MPRVGRSYLAAGLLVVTAGACTRPIDEAAEAGRLDPSPVVVTPVTIGSAVPGSSAANLERLESLAGQRLELVRVFARWDTPFPTPDHQAIIDSGRAIHLSVRPRRDNGENIAWSSLANATDGDPLMAEIDQWAQAMTALPPGSYVTLNHEPDTRDSAPNGAAPDFIGAWRNVMPRWSAGGSQAAWVLTGGRFSGASEGLGEFGAAEQWYPGDDVVDVVGADLYNWHWCQGGERPWREFSTLLAAPLEFARAHDKPLVVPEFGSVEDPSVPGRKAEWFDGVADTLSDPAIAADVEFVAYFNVTAPGGTWPDCVWDVDTSTSSAEAFARLVATDD